MLYETEKTGVTYFLGKKYPVYRMCVMIFPMSRDALLVIHIPLLHFSFYLQIPQRNDTSPFGQGPAAVFDQLVKLSKVDTESPLAIRL